MIFVCADSHKLCHGWDCAVRGHGTLMVQVFLFEEECYRYCDINSFCILFIADAPE